MRKHVQGKMDARREITEEFLGHPMLGVTIGLGVFGICKGVLEYW
jgi:hypothetical protein